MFKVNPKYTASFVVQVRANIRCMTAMTAATMASIFRGEIPYDENKHKIYFLGFFEECKPALIKLFMEEQNISREQILNIFKKLPPLGETYNFRKALANGKF